MRNAGIAGLILAATLSGARGEAPEQTREIIAFERANNGPWTEVFFDPCTENWQERWSLDGEIGSVRNTPKGMQLTGGPRQNVDAHHMVLWTKESFEGDVKIDYEYTRLDFETDAVTILYIEATGSGAGPYAEDIHSWSDLRTVPAMRTYFDHMNLYHVSYAAFPNEADRTIDYIRARRYMPEAKGLEGTDLSPDYLGTGLFAPGVPHHITVIKKGQTIAMRVENPDQVKYCYWENTALPPIEKGPIGLRHMWTRSARYRDFRISVPAEAGESAPGL